MTFDAAVSPWSFQGVTATYGKSQQGLHDVTLDCPPGVVGLIGHNGAGKSTLIRCLLGFMTPQHGTITHRLGSQGATWGAPAGYVGDQDLFIPDMSAVDFLVHGARIVGLAETDAHLRAHHLIDLVGLGEARYRTLRGYSTGMKQRVKLAHALIDDPPMCVLDEPTSGLDPQSREALCALVRSVADRTGKHILLSSHLLSEIETICDHVIVIAGGRYVTTMDVEASQSVDAPHVVELVDSDGHPQPETTRRIADQRGLAYRETPTGIVVEHLDPRSRYAFASEAALAGLGIARLAPVSVQQLMLEQLLHAGADLTGEVTP